MIFNYTLEHCQSISNQLLRRGVRLAATPAISIASVADVIIGLGAAVAAIGTLAQDEPLFQFAFKQLRSSAHLVSASFVTFILAMNPAAPFSFDKDRSQGWTSNAVFQRWPNLSDSKNPFHWYITSRLVMPLMLVALLVTRAVDAIVGTLAAVLSIVTGGHFENINTVAVRALQAPAIICDVFLCIAGFLNPSCIDEDSF